MEKCLFPNCVVDGELSVDLSIQRYYEGKEEPGMGLECRSTL